MKNIVLAILILSLLALGIRDQDRDRALDTCLEEVGNKCAGIFSYAVTLESENARLNNEIQILRADLEQCHPF